MSVEDGDIKMAIVHKKLNDTTVVPSVSSAPSTLSSNWSNPFGLTSTGIPIKEHAISGQMVTVSLNFTDHEMNGINSIPKDIIRKQLVNLLAEEIFKKGLVFYSQQYKATEGVNCVMARAYLVPSETVQLLRTLI